MLELPRRLERYFFEIPPVLAPTQSPATRVLLECSQDILADGHARRVQACSHEFKNEKIPTVFTMGIFLLELLSRLELPNLILTKDALYRLSYNSTLTT